jgi:hypothetical protein
MNPHGPRIAAIFSGRTPYLAWALVSSGLLLCTRIVDPYVFAFTAFAATALSAALTIAALLLAYRRIPWALGSALPTALAYADLSTYNWA